MYYPEDSNIPLIMGMFELWTCYQLALVCPLNSMQSWNYADGVGANSYFAMLILSREVTILSVLTRARAYLAKKAVHEVASL